MCRLTGAAGSMAISSAPVSRHLASPTASARSGKPFGASVLRPDLCRFGALSRTREHKCRSQLRHSTLPVCLGAIWPVSRAAPTRTDRWVSRAGPQWVHKPRWRHLRRVPRIGGALCRRVACSSSSSPRAWMVRPPAWAIEGWWYYGTCSAFCTRRREGTGVPDGPWWCCRRGRDASLHVL
jgi:hypothetical protein